ncbi:MAG: putative transcriptional regulator [Candidatus Nanosalina sp. J07AB43]|jgi:Predicted transcriptional regulators|nr:MAG: putative transcriptional regulator [Candidatus Nanosalina sp. J07AB43]
MDVHEFMDDKKAISNIVDLLSGKWTVKVFFELKKQPQTFTELSREIDGISNKMLSKTLKMLKDEGVLDEAQSAKGYLLTEKGYLLRDKLEELTAWSDKYMVNNRKVLILEDDSIQAELYCKWLEGFETETVDVDSVIERSDSETLAVIMDRRLEDQESDRFVKYLSGSGIPVIVCSGVEPSIEDTEMPFYNYLIKPLDKGSIQESLDTIRKQKTAETRVQGLENKKDLIRSRKIGKCEKRKERLSEIDKEIRSIN